MNVCSVFLHLFFYICGAVTETTFFPLLLDSSCGEKNVSSCFGSITAGTGARNQTIFFSFSLASILCNAHKPATTLNYVLVSLVASKQFRPIRTWTAQHSMCAELYIYILKKNIEMSLTNLLSVFQLIVWILQPALTTSSGDDMLMLHFQLFGLPWSGHLFTWSVIDKCTTFNLCTFKFRGSMYVYSWINYSSADRAGHDLIVFCWQAEPCCCQDCECLVSGVCDGLQDC